MLSNDPVFRVAPPVAEALERGHPVVALETALLTHGLPRPLNVEVFREMAAAVVQEGALPAAVGVVEGRIRVGLSDVDVLRLAEDREAAKAGLADLPVLVAQDRSAGATVAATLWSARRAGIEVFATGGLGGVHRGAAETFDVSGDLPALARWGGCVVCSGAKAVLDLTKTLEALETLGVVVVGYRTAVLPAFLATDSGLVLKHIAESPEAVADVLRVRDALGFRSTVVVANPPPPEHAIPRARLEEIVEGALEEVARLDLRGSAVTPALLKAISGATDGASVEANRALLVSNARLGARVARAFHARPRASG